MLHILRLSIALPAARPLSSQELSASQTALGTMSCAINASPVPVALTPASPQSGEYLKVRPNEKAIGRAKILRNYFCCMTPIDVLRAVTRWSQSPLNWTRYRTGTPSTEAARTQPHSVPAKRGWSTKRKGSSPAHANAKRNKTMVATGISSKATLPKKKPVPQRQPAVARARMGRIRPCRLNIGFRL